MLKGCLPICEASLEGSNSVTNATGMLDDGTLDYIEVYTDFLDRSKPRWLEELQTLINYHPNKVIITTRRAGFASTNSSSEDQIKLLEYCSKLPCYFDFDINRERDKIERLIAIKANDRLICSYHNYSETPELLVLLETLTQMISVDGYALKFATQVSDLENLSLLLKFLEELRRACDRWVLSPMGPFGKRGRMITAVLGSEWTYCRGDWQTAEGQLSISELEILRRFAG